MSVRVCAALLSVVDTLHADGVAYALVHESAIMGWGIDNNVFLGVIDILVLDDEGFSAFDAVAPASLGGFAKVEIDGVPVRLWSRASLGLEGPFDVTACVRYGCEALAPELVLAKLPYSPDARILAEQRARLASIVHWEELTREEISLVASYVRGD